MSLLPVFIKETLANDYNYQLEELYVHQPLYRQLLNKVQPQADFASESQLEFVVGGVKCFPVQTISELVNKLDKDSMVIVVTETKYSELFRLIATSDDHSLSESRKIGLENDLNSKKNYGGRFSYFHNLSVPIEHIS